MATRRRGRLSLKQGRERGRDRTRSSRVSPPAPSKEPVFSTVKSLLKRKVRQEREIDIVFAKQYEFRQETGPHAAMVRSGVSEEALKTGEFQKSPVTKSQVIQEVMGKYPSRAQNLKRLKVIRPVKGKTPTTGVGLRPSKATIQYPVLSLEQAFGGRAFFERQRTGKREVASLNATISARTRGLAEFTSYLEALLKELPTSQYQVALIAEAFRPTWQKILRYTPFDNFQRKPRVHILETAQFDYGVRGGGAFMRVSFGGSQAPHTEYAHDAPESYTFQDEGRPRWIEKAINEDFNQFQELVAQYFAQSVATGPGPGGHGGLGAAQLDKLLNLQLQAQAVPVVVAAEAADVAEQDLGLGGLSSQIDESMIADLGAQF